MKTKKRILSGLLVLALCIGLTSPAALAAGIQDGGQSGPSDVVTDGAVNEAGQVSEQLEGQDAQPGESQDAQPGESQDAQPGENQDAQPGENQDAQPGENQDAQPGENQDVQPGENQDAQPDGNQDPEQEEDRQPGLDEGLVELIETLAPVMTELEYYSEEDEALLKETFGAFWALAEQYYSQEGAVYDESPTAGPSQTFTEEQLFELAELAKEAQDKLGVLDQVTRLAEPREDNYAPLRVKWREYLLGGDGTDLDLTDEAVKTYIDTLNAEANEYYGLKTEKSTWADSNAVFSDVVMPAPDKTPLASGEQLKIRDTLRRLRSLAMAYATDGCTLYNQDEVLAFIKDAADYVVANHFKIGRFSKGANTTSGNWYEWEISMPSALGDIAMILYDKLSADQVSSYAEAIRYYVNSCTSPFLATTTMTGGNLLLKAYGLAEAGILLGNPAILNPNTDSKYDMNEAGETLLANVQRGVKGAISYNDPANLFTLKGTEDGIYEDGSLIQHQGLSYIGGYGTDLYKNYAIIAMMLGGTEWSVASSGGGSVPIYDFVFTGVEPFIAGGRTMDMTAGRDVTRSHRDDQVRTAGILSALLPLRGTFPTQEQNQRFESMMKYVIGQDEALMYSNMSSIYSVKIAKEIMDNDGIQARSGYALTKTFAMDRTVHHTEDFTLGIAMQSIRTFAHEIINNEGKKTWNTANGMVFLYDGDVDQYGGGYWATVDPTRLPGTTAEHVSYSTAGYGDRNANIYNWTGGSALGSSGAAGMYMKALSGTEGTLKTLTSGPRSGADMKKSWFMFDDRVLALGSSITGNSDNNVETIVENRKIKDDGSNTVTVDNAAQSLTGAATTLTNPKWMHLEGNVAGADIGYYFPNDITLQALKETRTGNWEDQGTTTGTATNAYATFYVDHGVKPTNAAYAYVLLPGKSAAQTADYAAAPDIEILAQDGSIHAARDTRDKVIAANFWKAGTLTWTEGTTEMGLTVSAPASVTMKTNADGTVTIGVSDPTQKAAAITVTLWMKNEGVVTKDATVTVDTEAEVVRFTAATAESLGQTHTATFTVGDPVEVQGVKPALTFETGAPDEVLSLYGSGRVYLDNLDGYAIESVEYSTDNANIEVDEFGNLKAKPGYTPGPDDTVTVTAKVNYYDPDKVVFADGFEGEQQFNATNGYTHSNANSLFGRYAVTPLVHTDNTNPTYTLPGAATDVTVTAWYYDANNDYNNSGTIVKYGLSVNGANNPLGIFYDSNMIKDTNVPGLKTNYGMRVQGTKYNNYLFGNSDVVRSEGWHKFEWIISSTNGMTVKIDGKVVSTPQGTIGTGSIPDPTPAENIAAVKSISSLALMTQWVNANTANTSAYANVYNKHFIDGVMVVKNDAATEELTLVSRAVPVKDLPIECVPMNPTVNSTNPRTVMFDAMDKNAELGEATKVMLDGVELPASQWRLSSTDDAPKNALVYNSSTKEWTTNYPDGLLVIDASAFKDLADGEHRLTADTMEGYIVFTTEKKEHTATNYYLSNSGSDSNDGHTAQTAWASFDKLSTVEFGPGDHIYLDAGSVWSGVQFRPKGSGAEGKPIVITSYNNGGDTSRRPILNGDGTVADKDEHSYLAFDAWRGFYPSGTIELFNVEYWEVRGIEITNYASTYSQEATGRNGIAVIYDYLETQGLTSLPSGNVALEQAFYRAGKLRHIVVDDCYIHDVVGYHPDSGASGKGGKMSGGINVYGPYDDVKLNNNIVMYCDVEGIRNDVLAWMGDTQVQFPCYMEGVEISNNFIAGVPGDGVVISSAEAPVISNNYLTDAGYSYFVPKAGKLTVSTDKAKAMGNRTNPVIPGNSAFAGMWFIGTNDAVAEYNELANNVWTNQDGEAFDADMFTDGTVFQYNYTYKNNGGFCLFMNTMGYGNIVRYNVSVYDGEGVGTDPAKGYRATFHYNQYPDAIYNNLFVLGEEITAMFGGSNNRMHFYNNIVLKPDGDTSNFSISRKATDGSVKNLSSTSGKLTNNLFYPASLLDPKASGDHKSTLTDNITPDTWEEVLGYFEGLDTFLENQPVKALWGRSTLSGVGAVSNGITAASNAGAKEAVPAGEGRCVATPSGTGFDYSQFAGLKLKAGSALIGAGIKVDLPEAAYQNYPELRDFFQHDLSEVESIDIGPYQWSQEVQPTGITVKTEDGTVVDENTVLKVYTNNDHPDLGHTHNHSLTLTAEVEPVDATNKNVNWIRKLVEGKVALSRNGNSLTVTAIHNEAETNVGPVELNIVAEADPNVKKTITVQVIRMLENPVSISIHGVNDPQAAPKYGQTLEADINQLKMTDAGKAALSYQWKRTKDGVTTNIGQAVKGEAGKTYTLKAEDVGATISVDVTADTATYYEGTRSAERSQAVVKADRPAITANIHGEKAVATDNSDGKIVGFPTDDGMVYEYKLASAADTTENWHTVSGAQVTVAAGDYVVRVQATATYNASATRNVTVPAYDTNYKKVNIDTGMKNGMITRDHPQADPGTTITLTVNPAAGYELATITVTGTSGEVTLSGEGNTRTFVLPREDVTVSATFRKIKLTIDHSGLTNLRCSKDVEGVLDDHKVEYGDTAAITLVPDEGYTLPAGETIEIINTATKEKITGWTIDDNGTITITGGVTSNLTIKAAGVVKTYVVNYTLTNGLSAPEANAPRQVAYKAAYTGKLVAASGYTLPESITVTMGGKEFTDFTYENGTLTIAEGKIDGNLVITAAGSSTPSIPSIPSTPSTTTKVEKNPDGSTTTTVTDKKTGTVTATTEKPDGTKQIVETKKDGTVTETTEKTDGTKQIVETRKDGTVTETVEKTDGTKEVVETRTDGTITETKIDSEGAKAEKVTDPEKNTEIKVTDATGEVVAEVKLPAEVPAPEKRFEDVPEGHWADEAIHEMAGLGIVNGVGDGRFDMNSGIKRGDLALLLARMSNAETTAYTASFTDVPAGKYYAGGVAWAAKNGVVTGRSEDTFDPEATITRGELAVMLYRYAKLLKMDISTSAGALGLFADGGSTPDWAADGVSWCVKNGIIRGRDDNTIDSGANVTRAEVAVMFQRFAALMK